MISSLGAALLGFVVAILSYGAASFFKGRKIRSLSDELSKQKRKNFDMELNHIRKQHDAIPLEDLLEDDEYIIEPKKD